jgi:hypothetical protein
MNAYNEQVEPSLSLSDDEWRLTDLSYVYVTTWTDRDSEPEPQGHCRPWRYVASASLGHIQHIRTDRSIIISKDVRDASQGAASSAECFCCEGAISRMHGSDVQYCPWGRLGDGGGDETDARCSSS